ncbi:hypothetical protein V1506DRAFT_509377 [Lipomyces tetrasporus]
MVSIKDVRRSNSSLTEKPSGMVAVFVGATSGIGLGTVKQFAKYSNAPKVYVVGRSKQSATPLLHELEVLNPKGIFIFVETEISLIKNVDAVCEEIKTNEQKLDLVFVSPGFLSSEGRKETSEGIDMYSSLSYYARLRIVHNLIPLLSASRNPRVVSILAGGKENAIDINDLELRKNYSLVIAANSAATQMTLAFEELAKSYPMISFCHVYPGLVATDIITKFTGTFKGIWVLPAMLARWTLIPVLHRFATTVDEAGERGLFVATSAKYPPAEPNDPLEVGVALPDGVEVAKSSVLNSGKGNGVYRVHNDSESVENEADSILEGYRLDQVDKTIWEQTLEVWKAALEKSESLSS